MERSRCTCGFHVASCVHDSMQTILFVTRMQFQIMMGAHGIYGAGSSNLWSTRVSQICGALGFQVASCVLRARFHANNFVTHMQFQIMMGAWDLWSMLIEFVEHSGFTLCARFHANNFICWSTRDSQICGALGFYVASCVHDSMQRILSRTCNFR